MIKVTSWFKEKSEKVNKILSWKFISDISKNTFVNKTLIWVIITPIIAKLLSKTQDTIILDIAGSSYILDLELPFSWVFFYFSALLFLIGNILYKMSAPLIIKDNNSYTTFLNDGKDKHELKIYLEDEGLTTNDYFDLSDIDTRLDNDIRNDYFWEIWNSVNYHKPYMRIIISSLYLMGIGLISYIFYENLSFVINSFFHN